MALRSQGISYLKLAPMDFHHATEVWQPCSWPKNIKQKSWGEPGVKGWNIPHVRPFLIGKSLKGGDFGSFFPLGGGRCYYDVIYSDRLYFPEQILSVCFYQYDQISGLFSWFPRRAWFLPTYSGHISNFFKSKLYVFGIRTLRWMLWTLGALWGSSNYWSLP